MWINVNILNVNAIIIRWT